MGCSEAMTPNCFRRGISALSMSSICSMRWRLSRDAIGLARRFIAIKGAAHAAIADGVNADLKPMLVGAGGDFIELRGGEQRRAALAGKAGVIIKHQRGHGFQNAIHENFHAAGMQHVALILLAHFNRFIDAGGFEIILLVEGHLDAGDEFILVHERLQQLKLIPVAVHVVDGGDAEGGAVFQPALHEVLVDEALGGGGGRHGIFAGHHAQPFAPARGGEVQQRRKGRGFAQFAGGQPVASHDDFIAGGEAGAMQKPAGFQRLGIGPDRVVVKADERQGPVGDDAVQNLAGDGRGVAQRHGRGAIDDDDPLLRVGRRHIHVSLPIRRGSP